MTSNITVSNIAQLLTAMISPVNGETLKLTGDLAESTSDMASSLGASGELVMADPYSNSAMIFNSDTISFSNSNVITGGTGNDVINMGDSTAAYTLSGGAGNDSITGGAGNDTIIGGAGADTLVGGGGADKFVYQNIADSTTKSSDMIDDFTHNTDKLDLSTTGYTSLVAQGKATEVGELEYYRAGSGTVVYDPFSNFSVTLDSKTFATNDILFGKTSSIEATGNNTLTLGETGSSVIGHMGDGTNSLIVNNSESNVISAGSGTDTINLSGSTGNNFIYAGSGTDTITGGSGADTMTAGSGHDTFVFNSLSQSTTTNSDIINDFHSGSDKLDVSALGYTSLVSAGHATVQGELQYAVTSTGVVVSDPFSHFSVTLNGLKTISASDLVLKASNNVITVSSTEELLTAMSKAVDGQTIKLTGGDYGAVNLSSVHNSLGMHLSFPTGINIVAADPTNPPIFSSLAVYGATGINFDGLHINQDGLNISHATNISFKNGDITSNDPSAVASGELLVNGVEVNYSTNVVIANNNIHNVASGLQSGDTTNLTLSGNTFTNNAQDNTDIGRNMHTVLIENNIYNSPLPNDPFNIHLDNIQFWTDGSSSNTTNVTITGNQIYDDTATSSADTSAHGIFIRADYGNGYNLQNLKVENNTIISNNVHGITVEGVTNGTIQNNTVINNGAYIDSGTTSINVGTSTNVTVANNVASAINLGGAFGANTNVTTSNNIIANASNEGDANSLENLFVNGGATYPLTVADLVPAPGGLLDLGNGQYIGSLTPGDTTAKMTPVVTDTFKLVDDAYHYTLDASHTILQPGESLTGATYTWKFADGTTATGETISHVFSTGGKQDVDLTITDKSGKVFQTDKVVDVINTHAVSVSFDTPNLTSNATISNLSNLSSVAGQQGKGVHLNGGASMVVSDGVDLSHLTALTFSMSLNLGTSFTGSAVLLNEYTFGNFTLDPNKDVLRFISPSGNSYSFQATSNMLDGNWHNIALTVDANNVAVYVDGKVLSYAPSTSALMDSLYNATSFNIGGVAHGTTFTGNVDNINMFTTALTADQISTLYTTNTLASTALSASDAAAQAAGHASTNSYGSRLVGDAGNDTIVGTAGNDNISGGDGNDIITGGGGKDTLSGGAGNNTFVYKNIADSTNASSDTITDFKHGADKLDLSATGYTGLVAAGHATQVGQLEYTVTSTGTVVDDPFSNFSVTLTGVKTIDANDILFGKTSSIEATGNNTLTLGETGASVIGHMGNGNNTLNISNSESNVISAGNGTDTINLSGSTGNNFIYAGSGTDTITGGAGVDTMTGGAGHDTFVFKNFTDSTMQNHDTIVDFVQGQDKIDISALHITAADLSVKYGGAYTIVYDTAHDFDFFLQGRYTMHASDYIT